MRVVRYLVRLVVLSVLVTLGILALAIPLGLTPRWWWFAIAGVLSAQFDRRWER